MNDPRFNWFKSISFTNKENYYKIPPITLVLKYICNFSYSMTHLFWHKYISYFKFVNVYWSFKKINSFKYKAKISLYSKWTNIIQDMKFSCTKKNEMQNFYVFTTIVGGHSVF
jgi:hypothetical protein